MSPTHVVGNSWGNCKPIRCIPPKKFLVFLVQTMNTLSPLTLRIGNVFAAYHYTLKYVELLRFTQSALERRSSSSQRVRSAEVNKTSGLASFPLQTEVLGRFRSLVKLAASIIRVIWVLRTAGQSLVERQISKWQVWKAAVVFDSKGIGKVPLAMLLPDYRSQEV